MFSAFVPLSLFSLPAVLKALVPLSLFSFSVAVKAFASSYYFLFFPVTPRAVLPVLQPRRLRQEDRQGGGLHPQIRTGPATLSVQVHLRALERASRGTAQAMLIHNGYFVCSSITVNFCSFFQGFYRATTMIPHCLLFMCSQQHGCSFEKG